jgi:hypothetical protein
VPLWDNVRLRSDAAPDFSECGSVSSQNVIDIPPWWAVLITPVGIGVIDTAHHWSAVSLIPLTTNFKVEYLREHKAICKKALTHLTEAQMELFDAKSRGQKSCYRATLKGQSHEIFDPQFFSTNNTPGSPDS